MVNAKLDMFPLNNFLNSNNTRMVAYKKGVKKTLKVATMLNVVGQKKEKK